MSLTPTKPIPLGFDAPYFDLPDVVTGKNVTVNDIKGKKGTLVMFICNHCPYVKHVIHELEFQEAQQRYYPVRKFSGYTECYKIS